MKNSNKFYPKVFLSILFGAVLIFTGCSHTVKEADEKMNTAEITAPPRTLPPVETVNPDDPYLFLPLENLGFRLTFTEEVDRDTIKEAISFNPEIDFSIGDNSRQYIREIYLQPVEKLRSDTAYTLLVENVRNKTTGEPETITFAYRTEFHCKNQISKPLWSHDGREILYLFLPEGNDTAELWKVNIKDGYQKLLAADVAWPGRAAWSPDDSTILYTKMLYLPDKNYLVPEICLVDREGEKEDIIIPAQNLGKVTYDDGPAYPASVYAWWSPDGKKIALQLDMAGVDAHSDLPRFIAIANNDGKELRALEGRLFAGWQNNSAFMVLKTHQNYNYGHSYRYDLVSVPVNGKEPARLLLGEGQISNLDMCSQSSDYRTLAVGHWESFAVGNYFKKEGTKINLYNTELNSLTPIGLDRGYQKHPAVDPSGKRVAFAANKEGCWDIYLWANGTAERLTAGPGHESYPAWSPQGKKLAFVSTRNGGGELWLLDLPSGNLTPLTGTVDKQ